MRSALSRRHGFPYKRRWPKTFVGGEALAVTFPSSPLTTRVYIALGADLTASYLTWNWLDITDRVRHDMGISVVAGRRDESTQVTASRCQMEIENDDGAFCRLNPLSPYYGLLTKNTPIWIQLDPGAGFVDRYFGFVNEWPTRWTDPSATDCTVTIQCAGVLRRLAKGRRLTSPLYRTLSGVAPNDYVPHAYWPMEDGVNSTQFASALSGHPPMVTTGSIAFAADGDLAGSSPLATLAEGAVVTAQFPAYTNTHQWVLQIALKVDTEPSVDTTYVEVATPGGQNALWRLHITPGSPSLIRWEGFNSSGVSTGTEGNKQLLGGVFGPSETDFYGNWWFYSLSTYLDGGQVTAGLNFTDTVFEQTNGGANGLTVDAAVTGIQVLGGNGISVGHLALFTDPAFDVISDALSNAAAMDGWDGEQAHERIIRLCREQGVPLFCQAGTSTALGPQPTGTLIEVLRDAERADQGVLYEYQFGLGYQALSERYNLPVSFDLDLDAGHIAGTPEHSDDDQRLVNRFTATRTDGSNATAELETGTLGTGAGGSGVYSDSATVNVEFDSQVGDYASWKVHVGTVDEDRWTRLGMYLHGTPELIPGWTSTPLGARVNVANPPSQMNPDTIDAVVEGYAERWDTVSWVVALNTSPASAYRIFTFEDADLGLTDSGSSTLAAAATSGASSLSVASSNAADLWSTDSADYPLSVRISGIAVTVTAVAGASSPQTFTVTGATVTKDLAAGVGVELANPTYLGM